MDLKDVSFLNLMQCRIFNVLIIANPYDAFMLEDDGRVDEKIFSEYMQLGLRYPPSFTQVCTIEEASDAINKQHYDLIICMPGNADNDAFDVARAAKEITPDTPCVVLTPFSHGISRRMENLNLSIFDYVFCWLGNTELILSIIKLIEDKMNVENDTQEAGVKCLLLVEDNIRFYSSILPHLYKYILTQSLNFATEALTMTAEMLRMRGRPKVLLARNYEEAWEIYSRYKEHMLGVISDCRFPKNGEIDPMAGMKFLNAVREAEENAKATVFGYWVSDPERYGVAEFDEDGNCLSIEEKPLKPKSNYAVVGLYFYPNKVVDVAAHIKPSARGELEITTVNQEFLKDGELKVQTLSRGFAWLDTGTHDSLSEASTFVEVIEKRTGLKIACLEGIAYSRGWITADQLRELAKPMLKNQYGQYLLKLAEN